MKIKMMPLHIQSMYIYILKYGFTTEDIYFNMYNKAPITSSKTIWTKTHAASAPFPVIAHSVEQAFHFILVHALLKPQIIDNMELPIGELKKDILTLIAEHAQHIPLRKRLFKMRMGHIVDNIVSFVLKGIK
jgi:hypothetical protein